MSERKFVELSETGVSLGASLQVKLMGLLDIRIGEIKTLTVTRVNSEGVEAKMVNAKNLRREQIPVLEKEQPRVLARIEAVRGGHGDGDKLDYHGYEFSGNGDPLPERALNMQLQPLGSSVFVDPAPLEVRVGRGGKAAKTQGLVYLDPADTRPVTVSGSLGDGVQGDVHFGFIEPRKVTVRRVTKD